MMKHSVKMSLLFAGLLGSACQAGPLVIDHRHADITQLTSNQIQRAKDVLHIAYGHTSHGSQVTDGMSGLVGFANRGGKGLSFPTNFFAWNNGGSGGALDLHDYAMGGDVGYYPDWVNNTRTYLNNPANSNVNVIIWSWCGQMSGKFSGGTLTNEFLAPMSMLETSYPDVVFVYMTGHVDIWDDANQKKACQAIREYCAANNKVLYDFADIEHYDPDGNYYEYVDDNCGVYTGAGSGWYDNWATNWQGTHTQNVDWYSCSSAHSQPLNANQKAYAAWALWCAIAADLNRDEIPDAWADRYGGADVVMGGTHDGDGDGVSDFQEYVADTIPTNSQSYFQFLNTESEVPGAIRFACTNSRRYSLEYCDDPCPGLWTGHPGFTNQTGEASGHMIWSPPLAEPSRLYRVGVALP